MNLINFGRIFSVTLLSISLAACNLQTPAGSSGNPAAGNPTATSENTRALCDNPLFPVKSGATWTYTNTGGQTGTFSFTDTITEVRSDGFTITTQFSDLTRTQEWTCKPEGLLALTFGGGSAGGISTQGMTLDIKTSNAAGVSIPANVQPEMEWTYNLDIAGTVNLAEGQTATADGTLSTPLKAIGMESVTVPAGTFDAMKVESTPTLNIQATYQGISIPVTITGNVTLWFAPGVGWVKSTESGNLAGNQFSSTTELQSFTIP